MNFCTYVCSKMTKILSVLLSLAKYSTSMARPQVLKPLSTDSQGAHQQKVPLRSEVAKD